MIHIDPRKIRRAAQDWIPEEQHQILARLHTIVGPKPCFVVLPEEGFPEQTGLALLWLFPGDMMHPSHYFSGSWRSWRGLLYYWSNTEWSHWDETHSCHELAHREGFHLLLDNGLVGLCLSLNCRPPQRWLSLMACHSWLASLDALKSVPKRLSAMPFFQSMRSGKMCCIEGGTRSLSERRRVPLRTDCRKGCCSMLYWIDGHECFLMWRPVKKCHVCVWFPGNRHEGRCLDGRFSKQLHANCTSWMQQCQAFGEWLIK